MIRPEHQLDIRPDLRKAASTKAESTPAESVIRPKQLVRYYVAYDQPACRFVCPRNINNRRNHKSANYLCCDYKFISIEPPGWHREYQPLLILLLYIQNNLEWNLMTVLLIFYQKQKIMHHFLSSNWVTECLFQWLFVSDNYLTKPWWIVYTGNQKDNACGR